MKRNFYLVHTVRYDECDCNGLMKPATFVRYMQDIAARDVEDAELQDEGYWIVKRTVISFNAPIVEHTRLELRTYGLGFTRVTAQRGYEARLADKPESEPLIVARTLWVYVDKNGRPARIPAATAQIWMPNEASVPQAEEPLPAMPERTPYRSSTEVQFSEIDKMQHLNNASAVEMLDNAGWQGLGEQGISPKDVKFRIRHYDIDYNDSPLFGERLEIQSWTEKTPEIGGELNRIQYIRRNEKTMIRARSKWTRQE